MTFRLLKKSVPHSIQNHTAHTLIMSNCCCHDRSISESAAIKIIWLWAQARNYGQFWPAGRLLPSIDLPIQTLVGRVSANSLSQ